MAFFGNRVLPEVIKSKRGHEDGPNLIWQRYYRKGRCGHRDRCADGRQCEEDTQGEDSRVTGVMSLRAKKNQRLLATSEEARKDSPPRAVGESTALWTS